MFIYFLGLLVILIIVISENNKLKKENLELKKIIFNNNLSLEGKSVVTNSSNVNVENKNISVNPSDLNVENNYINNNVLNSKTIENESISSISKTININNNNLKIENINTKEDEKEIKNSLILIVGSIFIVLSAIIFLTSTWNSIHSLTKTITIFLMFFVFLIASKISEKLNIRNTSNAFYYISMAYLPIAFLSISVFSLIGKYWSIYGNGKYWYLSIISFIMSIIYIYIFQRKKIIRLFMYLIWCFKYYV